MNRTPWKSVKYALFSRCFAMSCWYAWVLGSAAGSAVGPLCAGVNDASQNDAAASLAYSWFPGATIQFSLWRSPSVMSNHSCHSFSTESLMRSPVCSVTRELGKACVVKSTMGVQCRVRSF